jgi:uncharacterized protein (TIGR02266 family)
MGARTPGGGAATPEKRRRQRNTLRLRVDLQIDVSLESNHNFYSDMTRSVARGGLFVHVPALHPLGTQLRILLNLPGLDAPLEVDAVVAWLRDVGDVMEHGMGLRLIQPPRELCDAIDRFTAHRDTILYEVN